MNRYKPHIIVLPEDRADEEIANGFIEAQNVNYDLVKIERPVGGWQKVLDKFTEIHVSDMRKFPEAIIVLLIDFDGRDDRLSDVEKEIPEDIKDRVFVLGVKYNPEILKKDMNKKNYEIGEALARDCSNNTNEIWGHDHLKHNQPELDRIISSVKPFLFV
ncbi:MAG: hypothetical protein AB4290_27125 [Spirulina sp.]